MSETNFSSKKTIHNIIMENRENLNISGIKSVENFDENIIILQSEMGELTIKGDNLHIAKMDIDTGDMKITGNIFGLIYNETSKGTSVFKRIFK
ncbi:MAG: sporulation protein YabP [Acutalibacteraceae bacterium]|nr:sporulation protein YabP [Acutalibacteraceae bacterium]